MGYRRKAPLVHPSRSAPGCHCPRLSAPGEKAPLLEKAPVRLHDTAPNVGRRRRASGRREGIGGPHGLTYVVPQLPWLRLPNDSLYPRDNGGPPAPKRPPAGLRPAGACRACSLPARRHPVARASPAPAHPCPPSVKGAAGCRPGGKGEAPPRRLCTLPAAPPPLQGLGACPPKLLVSTQNRWRA